MIPYVNKVLVLGGGSAGFLAAISLKTLVPRLAVEVVRSPEIGVIGVGEATTPALPSLLHGVLNMDVAEFYRLAQPAWKLGIRFLWGPRPEFNYPFLIQTTALHRQLPRNIAYYCDDDFSNVSLPSALIAANRVFARQPDGMPEIGRDVAYHLENETFVAFLEGHARKIGVVIHDDTVCDVTLGERGVESLRLERTGVATADLFIDSSGFRSLLLGKALGEPFLSYKKSLYCDRAIIGGWPRGPGEPILPYTTAETMSTGWCWRIDHEDRINRGYVFSSDFLSADEATAEFKAKNPKVTDTRIIKFVSGRYRESWVKNVVAIGNSSGFVEPLESTALPQIPTAVRAIASALGDTEQGYVPDASIRLYNKRAGFLWDGIRDFLAVHYRFNSRYRTPFWNACLADVDLAGAAPVVEYYQECGPSSLWDGVLLPSLDQFGLDGYWTLLVGQKVPYKMKYRTTERERLVFREFQAAHRRAAAEAMTCEEAFAAIRRPNWRWNNDFYVGRPPIPLTNGG